MQTSCTYSTKKKNSYTYLQSLLIFMFCRSYILLFRYLLFIISLIWIQLCDLRRTQPLRQLKKFLSLYCHYQSLLGKLNRSPPQSTYRRCLMKQKAVVMIIITIKVLIMVMDMITMVMLTSMELIIWTHMGLVMDIMVGESDHGLVMDFTG